MFTGPNVTKNGLVLDLDASNPNCVSPAGNEEFGNSEQFIKNLSNKNTLINSINGVKLGNLNYYTAFAINYPESSYGGDAANRDGLTPGFNVTSGTKIFDYGRALNYIVWDKITQAFVKTTTYDSYTTTTAGDVFATEYNSTIQSYPNAIHILAGSHRDRYHTANQYVIMKDLGAPSNVEAILDPNGAPEWILVGEPGLKPDNHYVWSYQNYSVDTGNVAHAVFPLPINEVNVNNYFEFDGTNNQVSIDGTNMNFSSEQTIIMVLKPTESDASRRNPYNQAYGGYGTITHETNGSFNYYHGTSGTNASPYQGTNSTFTVKQNELSFIALTRDSSNVKWYKNGILVTTQTNSYPTASSSVNTILIGDGYTNPYLGNIYLVKVYDKSLSQQEISQIFNATKKRFNL